MAWRIVFVLLLLAHSHTFLLSCFHSLYYICFITLYWIGFQKLLLAWIRDVARRLNDTTL